MTSIILGIFDDFKRKMSTFLKSAPLIWPRFLRIAFIRRHLKEKCFEDFSYKRWLKELEVLAFFGSGSEEQCAVGICLYVYLFTCLSLGQDYWPQHPATCLRGQAWVSTLWHNASKIPAPAPGLKASRPSTETYSQVLMFPDPLNICIRLQQYPWVSPPRLPTLAIWTSKLGVWPIA